jgi:hypothetical protein
LGPEVNQTSIVPCAFAKFGIGVCTGFDGHETHFDMPTETYNDVEAGVICAKDISFGTKAI